VMSSTGEATGPCVVPPSDEVTIVGTAEDSVDRRPSAVVVVVTVVAGAVSCVLVPKGGGSEPRGWVKAGTKEKRLDRDVEEGAVGSVAACESEMPEVSRGRDAGVEEDEDDDGACVGSEAAAAELVVLLAVVLVLVWC